MARKRPYNLLCPIARALDVLGDRWTLLILRDLHAGPARFGELERGLGLAPNLLTQRLGELADAGLIERVEPEGRGRHPAYALTGLGRRTDLVLWELSRFGAALPPDPDPRPAGNLRTVVLPLRILLEQVDDRPAMTAKLLIDGEPFLVRSDDGGVVVGYGQDAGGPADLVVATDYPSFLAAGEGRMEPAAFAADHVDVVDGIEHLPAFLGWLGAAVERQVASTGSDSLR